MMELITVLKIAHLVGLMAGLGGALYTDFLVITKGILKPLTAETISQVKQLSQFVTMGLVLLWISGGLLALEILKTNPNFVSNEKFWAKVVMVSVLTLNGFLVHAVVLKEAQNNIKRRLLIDSNTKMAIILAATGSVSFVSWVIPFILGKTPEFSYVIPFEIFIFFWLVTILSAVASVLSILAIEEIWRERKQQRERLSF